MRWTRTFHCLAVAAAVLVGTAISADGRQAKPAKAPAKATPAKAIENAELELQVLLDRAGFSPGEIDGAGGQNTQNAQSAFAAARGLSSDAQSQGALLKALGAGTVEPVVSYTITAEDAAGPFTETIPEDMTEKSKLPGLYYTSVIEALGERFHAAPALLKRLNPGASFAAGEQIKVAQRTRRRSGGRCGAARTGGGKGQRSRW